jgi:fluoride ion exporter CrcB/FEX
MHPSKEKSRAGFAIRIGVRFPVLGMLLLATSIYKRRWDSQFDVALLAMYCIGAFVLTAISWRKMWVLDDSQWPLWAAISAVVASPLCLIGLMMLNDRGIFIWSRLYVLVPLLICVFGIAIGAWLTEIMKRVRVYTGISGYVFVPKVR